MPMTFSLTPEGWTKEVCYGFLFSSRTTKSVTEKGCVIDEEAIKNQGRTCFVCGSRVIRTLWSFYRFLV